MLESQPVSFDYIDFRKSEFNLTNIQEWLDLVSIDKIVNPKSKAWKELDEQAQAELMSGKNLERLVDTPTLIKRPVLQTQSEVLFGFNADDYQQAIEGGNHD